MRFIVLTETVFKWSKVPNECGVLKWGKVGRACVWYHWIRENVCLGSAVNDSGTFDEKTSSVRKESVLKSAGGGWMAKQRPKILASEEEATAATVEPLIKDHSSERPHLFSWQNPWPRTTPLLKPLFLKPSCVHLHELVTKDYPWDHFYLTFRVVLKWGFSCRIVLKGGGGVDFKRGLAVICTDLNVIVLREYSANDFHRYATVV